MTSGRHLGASSRCLSGVWARSPTRSWPKSSKGTTGKAKPVEETIHAGRGREKPPNEDSARFPGGRNRSRGCGRGLAIDPRHPSAEPSALGRNRPGPASTRCRARSGRPPGGRRKIGPDPTGPGHDNAYRPPLPCARRSPGDPPEPTPGCLGHGGQGDLALWQTTTIPQRSRLNVTGPGEVLIEYPAALLTPGRHIIELRTDEIGPIPLRRFAFEIP